MSFFALSDELPAWVAGLPDGWKRDWLKWSVRLSTEKPDDEEKESLPYISNEDIASWTGNLLTEDLRPSESESRKFLAGDVLFNKLRPYLAKVYQAKFDGVSSGELLCLRPSDSVFSRYLFYVLISKGFIETVNAETFGTKMPRADWEIVGHQPLPLPPLQTQRRIAHFLDDKTARIDSLIEKKRALLERLAEKRQALITRAVTKGLNPEAPMKPSGIDWLGDIPAHWEMQRLDRLTNPRRPIRYGIVLPGPHVEDGVPIIKGGDVRPDRLNWNALSRTTPEIDAAYSRSRLKAGDIVYSIRGSFGDVELLPVDLDGINLTQDAARISPIKEIDREWLLFVLKSDAVLLQMTARAIGATIKGVNIRDLRRALLPIPPPNEQERIKVWLNESVHGLDYQHRMVERSRYLLEEYRSALITAAVTGKLEVA